MSGEVKTVSDLNPRSQAVKGLETTVLRALQLIDAFDPLEPGQDWTDVPNPTYRKIIGPRYEHGRMLEEVFNRFKSGTLYAEVLALHANLPPAAQQRTEIKNGVDSINARLDSEGKGPAVRPARRARGTKR